jgi:hypothetical protein
MVAKIREGTKTMAMEIVRDRWRDTSDGIGERDDSCPFGEVGDLLTVHPASLYGKIILQITAIRKVDAETVTEDDAVRTGYDSVETLLAFDPAGRCMRECVNVWVCEFKRMEAPE